ncbi:MAG TPA: molybdopterin synthase sulfur carrier subunit [Hyphomonadaceae bacterium]|nr:molybdopterin synthase sulfur carrier subunit [Hyphomonadaceae bacterium]
MTTILFFGRLRDRTGEALTIRLAPDVRTVSDLRRWLDATVEGLHCAEDRTVRFVADGEIVVESADISKAREIALIPPVSGG